MLNASNGYKESVKNLWSPSRLIRKKSRVKSTGLKQGLLSNRTDDDSDNDVGNDNSSTSHNVLSQHDAVTLEDARINENKRQQAVLSKNNKVGRVGKIGKQKSLKPTTSNIASQQLTNDFKQSEVERLTSKGQENTTTTKGSNILVESSTIDTEGAISITYDNPICNSVQTHNTKREDAEELVASETQVSREDNNTEWEVFGDSKNKEWTEKVGSRHFLAPTTTIQSQKLENNDVKSLFEIATVSNTPTTVVAVVSNYQSGLPWEQPSHASSNVHRTGRLGITERIDVFDPHLDATEHSYDYMPRRLNRDLSNPSLDGSGILSMSESFEVETFISTPPKESVTSTGNLQKNGNNQRLGLHRQQGRSNEANCGGGGKGNSHSLKKLFSSLPDGTGLLELDTGSPMSQSITSRSLLVSPQIQPSNEIHNGQQCFQHPPNHTIEDRNRLFNCAGHSHENSLSKFTYELLIGQSSTQTVAECLSKMPLDHRSIQLDESNQQSQFSRKEIALRTPSNELTSRHAKGESNSMRKIFSSIYTTATSLQFDVGSPMSQSCQGISTESTYSSTDTAEESNFAGDKAVSLVDPYANCVHAEYTRHQATAAPSDYDDIKDSCPKARLSSDAALKNKSRPVYIQSVGSGCAESLECESKIKNKQIDANQSIVHLASLKNEVNEQTVPGATHSETNKSTEVEIIQPSFSLDVPMPPPGNVTRLAATFKNLLSLDHPNRDEAETQSTVRVNDNRSLTTALGDESFGTIHRYAFPSLKSFHPIIAHKSTFTRKGRLNVAQYENEGTFNGHWGQEYSLNNSLLMNAHNSMIQQVESVAHPVPGDAEPGERAVRQKNNVNVSNSKESIHDELLTPHANKALSHDIDFADRSPESFFRVVAERDTNLFSADQEAKQRRSSLPHNRGVSSYSDIKIRRRSKSVTFNAAKDSIHLIESRDHLQSATSPSFEDGSDIEEKLEENNNTGDSHVERKNSSSGKKQNETGRRNIQQNLELQLMDRLGNKNQIYHMFEEDLSEDYVGFDGDTNPFIKNDKLGAIEKENTYSESVVPVATATHVVSLTDQRDDSSGNYGIDLEAAFVATFDSVKDTVEYTNPYVQQSCPSGGEGALIRGVPNGHETSATGDKAKGKPQPRKEYLGIASRNQATIDDVFTDDSMERTSKVDHNSTVLHLHKSIPVQDNQYYDTPRTDVPKPHRSRLDNKGQQRPIFYGNSSISFEQMDNQKWNEPYEEMELEHFDVHRRMRRVCSSLEPMKQTTFDDVCAQDAILGRTFIGRCSPEPSRPEKSDGLQEGYNPNILLVRGGPKKNNCGSLEQGRPSFLDKPQPNLEHMHYLSSEKSSTQVDKVLDTFSVKTMLPTNDYFVVESLNHAIVNDVVANGISKTQSTIENEPKHVHIQPLRQHVDDESRMQISNRHQGNSNINIKADVNQTFGKAFLNLGSVANVSAKKTPLKQNDWSNSMSLNEVTFEVDWAEDTVLNKTSNIQSSNEQHLTVPVSQLSRLEENKRHASNYGPNRLQKSTVFLGNSCEATERMENLSSKPHLTTDLERRTVCVRVESDNITTFDDAFAQTTTTNMFNAVAKDSTLNLKQRSSPSFQTSRDILRILDSNQFDANLQQRYDIGAASIIETSVDDDLTHQSTVSIAPNSPCAFENDQSHFRVEFHRNREDKSIQLRANSHRNNPSQISAVDFVGAETILPNPPTGSPFNRKDEATNAKLAVANRSSRPRPNENSTVHSSFARESVFTNNEPCTRSVPTVEAKKIVSPVQVRETRSTITTEGEGLDSTSNLYTNVFRMRVDVRAEISNIPWVFDISKNNSIHEESAASDNFTDAEMGRMTGESLTESTDEQQSNQLANIATAASKSNIRQTFKESHYFAPEHQASERDNSISVTQHTASKDCEAHLTRTESNKSSLPTHQQRINVVSNAKNEPEPSEGEKRYHTFVMSPAKHINCHGITGGGTSHLRWSKITTATSQSNLRQPYQDSDEFVPEHQATERESAMSVTHHVAMKDREAHMWNTESNTSSFPTHQEQINIVSRAINVANPSVEEGRYLSFATSPDKQISSHGKTDTSTSRLCKNEIPTNASKLRISQTYNESNSFDPEHQATEREVSISATKQMAIKDREALWHSESSKSSLPTHQQEISIVSSAINAPEPSNEEKRHHSFETSSEKQLSCQGGDDKSVSHLRKKDICNSHSMSVQSTRLLLQRYETSAESRDEVSMDKVKNVEPQRNEGVQRNLELKERTVNLYEHPISRMRKLSDGFVTTEQDGMNPRPFNKLANQLSSQHSSLRQQTSDEGKMRTSSDVLPHIHQQGVDEWPSDQQQDVSNQLDKSISSIKRRSIIDDIPVEYKSPPKDRIRKNSFDSNSAVNDSDGVLSNAESTKYYRNLLQFNNEQQVNKRIHDNVHANTHAQTPESNFRRSKSYESLIDEQNKLLTFSLERQRRYHQHTITTCSFDTISTVKSSERQPIATYVNEGHDTYDRLSQRDTHTMFEPQPVLRMNPDDFEQYKTYSTSRSNFSSRYHQDRSATTNLYENDLDSSNNNNNYSNNINDPSFVSGMLAHSVMLPQHNLRYQERHNINNKRGRPSFYNMKSLLSDDTYANETEEIKTISGISLLGVEDNIRVSSAPSNGKDTTTIDNDDPAAAETQQDVPGFLCCSFLLVDAIDFTIRAKNWGKETK